MEKKLLRYLIVGALFIMSLICLDIRADMIEKSYKFRGVIEKVMYSDKGMPIVMIGGSNYAIGFPLNDFDKKIDEGDSLIKENDSRIYKLVKNKTKEILYSK